MTLITAEVNREAIYLSKTASQKMEKRSQTLFEGHVVEKLFSESILPVFVCFLNLFDMLYVFIKCFCLLAFRFL